MNRTALLFNAVIQRRPEKLKAFCHWYMISRVRSCQMERHVASLASLVAEVFVWIHLEHKKWITVACRQMGYPQFQRILIFSACNFWDPRLYIQCEICFFYRFHYEIRCQNPLLDAESPSGQPKMVLHWSIDGCMIIILYIYNYIYNPCESSES